MIGTRVYKQSTAEKRCPSCHEIMLAPTVENAKIVAERRGLKRWAQTLNGLNRKIYCCTDCGSKTAYEHHCWRSCTLKSTVEDTPKSEVA